MEYLEALAVALVLAFVIRTFVVQAFKIPSGSMLDTLLIGDHLLVNKFLYGTHIPFTDTVVFPLEDPQRGDVIVFEFPEDTSKDFIKRIIGVPGDVIEMKEKVVTRNGEVLNEPYIKHTDPAMQQRRDNFGPVTVPAGKYFVMGDNRDESYDSRFWASSTRGRSGQGLGHLLVLDGPADIRWSRIGQMVR